MKKRIFSINPKSYMYGAKLVDFALFADKVAASCHLDVYLSSPFVQIEELSRKTHHLIITAQSMDPIEVGQGMGKVLPESLKTAGARAVVLNHVDKSLSCSDLVKSIQICRKLKIQTLVCAGDLEEIEMISVLRPDIMICETADRIGQGVSSQAAYMLETKRRVKKYSKDTRIIQAGGITDQEDILKAIVSGADGVGLTTGLMLAPDPYKKCQELMTFLDKLDLEQSK